MMTTTSRLCSGPIRAPEDHGARRISGAGARFGTLTPVAWMRSTLALLAMAALLVAPSLSTAQTAHRESHFIPLFLPASSPGRMGLARIINHSNKAGTVDIVAIDDAGEAYGPVSLTLGARATRHFTSADLERGNPEQEGLSVGVGSGQGRWRLHLETDLDIEALAFVRTDDGSLTSVHDVVREAGRRWHVATFNPGSNLSQRSRLRVMNTTEEDVEVTIRGRDDAGEASAEEVRLTLAARAVRELESRELESGGEGFDGRLGDGTGGWQLFVSATGAIEVMSLLETDSGRVTNLSTTTLADAAVTWEGVIVEALALVSIVKATGAVERIRLLETWEDDGDWEDDGGGREDDGDGRDDDQDPDEEVHIPDLALRVVIEKHLNKARGAPITAAEMEGLTRLDGQHSGIRDLTGLEYATGLSSLLYLQRNHIADISPLSGLTGLWNLCLYDNQITDISPLSGMTGMKDLCLDGNQITDISPLSGMTGMSDLGLSDNQITDISPLSDMTGMEYLSLGRNQIADISPLSGMTGMRGLGLSDNQITDISPLSGLTILQGLKLSGNQITDISPLSGLTILRRLELYGNQIADISPLLLLTRLEEVDLSWNPLSEASCNEHIPALRALGANVYFRSEDETACE